MLNPFSHEEPMCALYPRSRRLIIQLPFCNYKCARVGNCCCLQFFFVVVQLNCHPKLLIRKNFFPGDGCLSTRKQIHVLDIEGTILKMLGSPLYWMEHLRPCISPFRLLVLSQFGFQVTLHDYVKAAGLAESAQSSWSP